MSSDIRKVLSGCVMASGDEQTRRGMGASATSSVTEGGGANKRVLVAAMAVILISIMMLAVNASLLWANTASTMRSQQELVRTYETNRAVRMLEQVPAEADAPGGHMAREQKSRVEGLGRDMARDLRVSLGVALFTTIVIIGVLLVLLMLLRRYARARAAAAAALSNVNQHLNRLVEERTAELTELSQHLIRVSEEEKAKLARELHDTLGSNLTAINMDLNWILKRMPAEQRELRERLQRSLQMLGDTVEVKHAVIDSLRPTQLDNLGLAVAMRSNCREFTQRTGTPCNVTVSDDFDDLNPLWSITFYRIAQEALMNVVKHAHAKTVSIELNREEGGIRMRILDDGVGLSEASMFKPKSYGLIGMRERMRQIGGTVAVRAGVDGRGTIVDAFIPYAPRPVEDANVRSYLRKAG